MGKHTETPWETNYTGNIWGDIENPVHDGDSPLVAFTNNHSTPTDQQKADSAFIVKAVNCHEGLVEALEQCQQEFVLSLRNTMLGNRIQNLLAIAKGESQ